MTDKSRKYEIAYRRQRQRNKIYDEVIRLLDEAADRYGIRKKDIADYLGVPPSQVSRWLSGPGNWTVDTVSDLLSAVKAEMDFRAAFDSDRTSKSNYFETLDPPLTTNTGSAATATVTIVESPVT